MLTPHRLKNLLSRFAGLSVMVVGDFFLDKYLVIDPELDEPSLETGLDAHQVVGRRCMPGAAGTVMANLHALGVGSLHALGVTGDDGEGYELRQGLSTMGVDLDGLLKSADRVTPTYIKPMVRESEGERESNRIDIQNRTPLPRELEDRIIEYLGDMAPETVGLVILDQVGSAQHRGRHGSRQGSNRRSGQPPIPKRPSWPIRVNASASSTTSCARRTVTRL